MMTNGDAMEMDELLMDANNNDSTVTSKEEPSSAVVVDVNGNQTLSKECNGDLEDNSMYVKLSVDQIETAKDIGISMR